uniref:F-box domain-containing protein n=2 Tax=Opuntia streptacantha TaxID=393608 RepID=A0A7C9AMA5_OPUST
MKKVQLSNRSLLELPSEVIWDILCRLPIKTCLGCKLVCQDWYDIITSPSFAALRGSYCSPRATLMLKCRFPNGRLNFLMLELDKESSNVDQMGAFSVGADHMIKFKSKFGVPNGKLFVVNVCNGLVCLKSDKRWDCYYVCNFLTSQFLTVKQSRPRFHYLYKYVLGSCPMDSTTTQVRLCGGSENPYICGLTPARGEVSHGNHCKGSYLMTHQYKLLRILKTGIQHVAEILTLGSEEWRRIDNAPKSSYNFQAFLNGSYHWYDNQAGECNIWAFHFGIEKFFRIPTPDEFKKQKHTQR